MSSSERLLHTPVSRRQLFRKTGQLALFGLAATESLVLGSQAWERREQYANPYQGDKIDYVALGCFMVYTDKIVIRSDIALGSETILSRYDDGTYAVADPDQGNVIGLMTEVNNRSISVTEGNIYSIGTSYRRYIITNPGIVVGPNPTNPQSNNGRWILLHTRFRVQDSAQEGKYTSKPMTLYINMDEQPNDGIYTTDIHGSPVTYAPAYVPLKPNQEGVYVSAIDSQPVPYFGRVSLPHSWV